MNSFLTQKQKRVLKLRESGKTQKEISEILGTSRSNVSLIEKRARENIERSKKTIKEWKQIFSPVNVLIEEGTDILDIPSIIYKKANEEGIKINLATVGIIEKIKDNNEELLDNRVTKKSFHIHITKLGDVLIGENDND
ncbi:transcriptional regulator [archaeon SCG-AAA382B04]|nr:transcriptional regulator [archaeon SCG-AAA382B04]